jgi:tetratricopeptide (TPR) repeat protein
VQVDFCRPPTVDRMQEMLADADQPYHILHFDGHGRVTSDGVGELCFEQPTDEQMRAATDPATASDLGAILAEHHLPLVMLEACQSGQVLGESPLDAVAPQRLHQGIGSVFAMTYAVHIRAARLLMHAFYRALVEQRSVGHALRAAREALRKNPQRFVGGQHGGQEVDLHDWFVPCLYQRGVEDLRLVTESERGAESRRPAPRPPAGKDETGGFPIKPKYDFHGRARELHRLERAFRNHRGVVLHAMGGMGKTALAREAAVWWTRTGLFPDGACFLSFEQPATAERIVQVLGTYLEGADFESLPADEQRTRAKELFQAKRVLMVWDNFESVLPAFQEGQGPSLYSDEERGGIRELFREWTEDETGNGRLLITSRSETVGLTGARPLELRGLARPDALALLARVMETHGVDLDDERVSREELEKLLDALADHPLSIELVGPHLEDLAPETIVRDFHELLDRFQREENEREKKEKQGKRARNASLLASLEFSTNRLSEDAQEALPWLGLFRGGVFEDNLLDVSEMEPEAWDKARGELEATALVRVESDVTFGPSEGEKRPYLRFHPTLPSAAARRPLADPDAARRRFIGVYVAVMRAVDSALRGSNPRGGMEVLAREEANVRAAVQWAIEDEAYDAASDMGDTVAVFLQMAGRLRERDAWVAWLNEEVGKGGFTEAAAGRERDAAWSLFTQGHFQQAVAKLENLIERLKATPDFDPAFQLAASQLTLGRILYAGGLAPRAIPILKDAAKRWEALADRAEDAEEAAETERGNLSATLGDLANALSAAGRLDEALAKAEEALDINRELGRDRAVAVGLGQAAAILREQGKYAEADARYEDALAAARSAGDQELEAITYQNQGVFAMQTNDFDRAATLYRQALKRFQAMGHDAGVMQTCNLLGAVEHRQGRLAEARAWYERSREIAEKRGAKSSLGVALQNLGIVCQEEGEAAREAGDEAAAREHFQEAARLVSESLVLRTERGDEPGAAESHGQLAQNHLLLGELDAAEEHAHAALETMERLGSRWLPAVYDTMAGIADARGDPESAAEWGRKRDAAVAELRRRAGEGGSDGTSEQLLKALAALAVACARVGLGDKPELGAQEEKAIAALEDYPAPFDALPGFLRALASGGEVPAVPPGLPEALAEALEQLLEAVREARSG